MNLQLLWPRRWVPPAEGWPVGLGEIARHIFVDSVQNDILATYDPYPTPSGSGDVGKAMEAMARSQYDTDRDGSATPRSARTSSR
jgi:hypothetical protein